MRCQAKKGYSGLRPKHFRLAFGLFAAEDAAGQEEAGSQHKSEIVPVAVVVDLVDIDAVHKKRQDEGDGGDQPMPDADEETCGFAVTGGDILDRVRAGGAGGKKSQSK